MLGVFIFLCIWPILSYFNVSIMYQLLISILIYQILKVILKKCFDIVLFDSLELTQILKEKNRCHLVTSIILDEKIDESFITELKENIFCHKNYEKLKFKPESNIFTYYWKRDEHFEINKHVTLLHDEEISTYEDLMKFKGKHLCEIPFEDDRPPWKFYLVKNFEKNNSLIVIKIHHNYGDAVSLLSFLMNIFKVKEYSFVNLRKPTSIQYFFAIAISIFKFPMIIISDLLRSNSVTPYHKGNNLSGKKIFYSCEPFDIKKIKEISKENGGTFNDAILAQLMKTIKNYSAEKHNMTLNEANFIISATLRPFPKPGEFCKMDLDIMPFVIDIPMINKGTISERIRFYNSFLKKFKMSMYNLINRYVVDILMLYLPKGLSAKMINWIGSKSSCVYTSVPGPINKIKFLGKGVERMYASVNLPFDCETTFVVFTYNQKCILKMVMDDSLDFNVKEFIEEWKKNCIQDFNI